MRRGRGRKQTKHLPRYETGDLFHCPRCFAYFARVGDNARAVAALVWHKRTCGETWERSTAFAKLRSRMYFACPYCTVKLGHHQSPKFLVKLIEEHLASHAARVAHQCLSCRSKCTG